MLYYIIIFGLLACSVQHSDSLFQDVVIASNETKITTIDGRDLGDQESPVDSRKLSSSNVERQDRLGSYWNRFRQQRKQNTDLKCDYSIKKDLSGCQQTKDGCQKLIEISSSSRLQNCRNFTYWTICPDDSCPKIQQRSKNAPWLNHECGYQFIRGPCERQQPGNSCSRNNVFKPTNQGRNCNPMDFVESCDPEECDDSDQEVVADYETNSKPKAECVYRASRNYCRYHVLQSQKEPSCVALETKSDESGRHACPQEQKWAICQESECRKRCDALMAAWSPWRPCLATCYSDGDDYARGIWPLRARYRPTTRKMASDDARFCRIRETGPCDVGLPLCRYTRSFPGGKLGGGDLSPTSATIALATWVTFAVGMALLILGLSILVALVYFRY